jgi:hypothetical protein
MSEFRQMDPAEVPRETVAAVLNQFLTPLKDGETYEDRIRRVLAIHLSEYARPLVAENTYRIRRDGHLTVKLTGAKARTALVDALKAAILDKGLRERVAEALLDPLKCCTVTPFPLTPIHGTCKDCWARALAAADLVLDAFEAPGGES